MNAGLPTQQTHPIIITIFLRYTTLRKRSLGHPQIMESVQKEMKDDISVSFSPKVAGNISLERHIAIVLGSV